MGLNVTDEHPLLTVFDRIYVINLAHRADRRREMDAQLRRIGLSLDHPAVVLFPASYPPDQGVFSSRGARGCFESHLRVHQAIVADGIERALVLEDDADFVPAFTPRIADLAPRLRDGWDMFYSVAPLTAQPGDAGLGGGLLRLSPGHGFQTTHLLGFTRAGSALAAEYLTAMMARPGGSPEGGPMHVDGAYCWMRRAHPDLAVWATEEPLARQRSSRSDITTGHFLDRIPILRDMAQLARRALR